MADGNLELLDQHEIQNMTELAIMSQTPRTFSIRMLEEAN